MKNTNRLLPLLLSLLLLAGCSAPAPAQGDAVTQTAAAETSGQTAEPANAQPADPFADSYFLLYEDPTLRIDLIYSLDKEGQTAVTMLFERLSESVETVWLENIVINGEYQADDLLPYFHDLSRSFENLSWTPPQADMPIQSLRCDIEVNHSAVQSAEVQIPEDFTPQLTFSPYLNSLAGPQELYNENGLRLTLLGAGYPVCETYSDWGALAIMAENTTGETLTVSVTGARLNNFFQSTLGINVLPPDTQTLFWCELLIDDSDLAQIGSSIGELALQFCIEAEERPEGYDLPLGTLWCPVTLAMHGEIETSKIDEVIYEDDTVRIGIIDKTEFVSEVGGYIFANGYIRYEWELAVENKSDRDLRVQPEDILTDGGIAKGTSFPAYIGAHSVGMVTVSYNDPDSGARQGLEFTMLLLEQEQEALIRKTDRIRLEP